MIKCSAKRILDNSSTDFEKTFVCICEGPVVLIKFPNRNETRYMLGTYLHNN